MKLFPAGAGGLVWLRCECCQVLCVCVTSGRRARGPKGGCHRHKLLWAPATLFIRSTYHSLKLHIHVINLFCLEGSVSVLPKIPWRMGIMTFCSLCLQRIGQCAADNKPLVNICSGKVRCVNTRYLWDAKGALLKSTHLLEVTSLFIL